MSRGRSCSPTFETLQGMAPGVAHAVRDATGGVLLYTPIIAAGDFDHALAYLFRRLDENSSGDNFLRHLFDLATDAEAFAVEHARFEVAVADRWQVSSRPRRPIAVNVTETATPTVEVSNITVANGTLVISNNGAGTATLDVNQGVTTITYTNVRTPVGG